MQRQRIINRALHQVTEFSSIREFLSSEMVPAGISTVLVGGIPLDILVSPSAHTSGTTVFFFHGAIEPHFTLPVLSGLGISGDLLVNRVFLSDPSLVLDDKLMLSWYAGNGYQPTLQSDLVKIIAKVSGNLNSERLVFFGGSGGGFAALYYGSYFDDSVVITFNPQTDIKRYHARAVSDYIEKAFMRPAEPHNFQEAFKDAQLVSDLCDHYSYEHDNLILYMQNRHDLFHVNYHMKPFKQRLHPENRLYSLIGDWGDGHVSPPKHLLTRLLREVSSPRGLAHTISELGFAKAQDATRI